MNAIAYPFLTLKRMKTEKRPSDIPCAVSCWSLDSEPEFSAVIALISAVAPVRVLTDDTTSQAPYSCPVGQLQMRRRALARHACLRCCLHQKRPPTRCFTLGMPCLPRQILREKRRARFQLPYPMAAVIRCADEFDRKKWVDALHTSCTKEPSNKLQQIFALYDDDQR